MRYLHKLLAERFAPLPSDPVQFFKAIISNRPPLEDLGDTQVEKLISVLEGLQAYSDDNESPSPAEQKMNFRIHELFRAYRYPPDPNLAPDDLDLDGETVYEYLITEY